MSYGGMTELKYSRPGCGHPRPASPSFPSAATRSQLSNHQSLFFGTQAFYSLSRLDLGSACQSQTFMNLHRWPSLAQIFTPNRHYFN